MIEAAREAMAFASGRTAQDLAGHRIRALAVLKCIEIVGEAASKVSSDSRAMLSQVPWVDVVGMRNRLIHAYYDIDFDRVSDTIFG